MKNYIKTIVTTIIISSIITACSSYDFGQEQYKNEVNLLSNSSMMYDKQVANLQSIGDTVYLVAGISGTLAPTQPFKVVLEKADSLFNLYNKSNYDIDVARFAKKLPENCYSIPSLEGQIAAGDFQKKFPVYLKNLDKLSPDSIYLLDYKINRAKSSASNKNKSEVLFRLFMKNEFATTKSNTYYNYTSSFITVGNATPRRPTSVNQVFPLGQDSVRMLAGDESFGDYNTARARIDSRSIRVTVGAKTIQNPEVRTVTIQPYRTLEVVQMTPVDIYDNTYRLNIISTPDGQKTYYKEFRLHYKYRLQPTDEYKNVKAVLRLEYNPRVDLL